MEIDFNPGRVPKSNPGRPVTGTGASAAAYKTASFPSTTSLVHKLNAISLVRFDRVEQTKALLADPTYPPVEVLTRIASLLAIHLED
jgi:hypothetical protein